MKLKNIIIQDLENAKKNKVRMVQFALEELLSKIGNLSNDRNVADVLEDIIEEKGEKALRLIRKNKTNNAELHNFSINLYNSYLCEYIFNKRRRIIYNFDYVDNNPKWDKDYEIEPKILNYKRKKFLNIF